MKLNDKDDSLVFHSKQNMAVKDLGGIHALEYLVKLEGRSL